VSKMNWSDIDITFRCYAWLCRKPPTTDALVLGILKAIEDTRELFKDYGIE